MRLRRLSSIKTVICCRGWALRKSIPRMSTSRKPGRAKILRSGLGGVSDKRSRLRCMSIVQVALPGGGRRPKRGLAVPAWEKAPGAQEVRLEGLWRQGWLANCLTTCSAAVDDLKRGRNVFITNIVKCRPPGNREPAPPRRSAELPSLTSHGRSSWIASQTYHRAGKNHGEPICCIPVPVTPAGQGKYISRYTGHRHVGSRIPAPEPTGQSNGI